MDYTGQVQETLSGCRLGHTAAFWTSGSVLELRVAKAHAAAECISSSLTKQNRLFFFHIVITAAVDAVATDFVLSRSLSC